jgi:hypothetical protein
MGKGGEKISSAANFTTAARRATNRDGFGIAFGADLRGSRETRT